MIPLIFWGITLTTAGYGAKKAYDANEKNEKAKKIISNAERRYKKEIEKLEIEKEKLNSYLQNFAKFKLEVYTNDIQKVIKFARRCKNVNSSFKNKNYVFTINEIDDMQRKVDLSLEITKDLGKAGVSGALTAYGVYGAVSLFGSASTGTAISTLSGVAARNATLAWLGGGSLNAGGLGMAGGIMTLGGVVVAPLIAIIGSSLDTQAEKNLTKAKEFEAKVDKEIAKMKFLKENFKAVKKRTDELKRVINILRDKLGKRYSVFYNFKFGNYLCKDENFMEYLYLAKKLKEILEIDLIEKNGNFTKNFNEMIERMSV